LLALFRASHLSVSCHGPENNFAYRFISGKEKSMLSENQRKLFADFHKSVEAEGILDEKTSHLIKVAAAMAFGCYP
jgi:alkylhydroperoxidase/carboxymuconolactone decarboxylase family protein YurZ